MIWMRLIEKFNWFFDLNFCFQFSITFRVWARSVGSSKFFPLLLFRFIEFSYFFPFILSIQLGTEPNITDNSIYSRVILFACSIPWTQLNQKRETEIFLFFVRLFFVKSLEYNRLADKLYHHSQHLTKLSQKTSYNVIVNYFIYYCLKYWYIPIEPSWMMYYIQYTMNEIQYQHEKIPFLKLMFDIYDVTLPE